MGYKLTILVAVERVSGMKMASMVPTKGATGAFAARRVIELMDECGDHSTTVIVKSDQEPAIKFLVKDIVQQRTSARTLVEESPKYSSASNGIVERAIQTCEGQIRSLKSQVDERYMVRIVTEHPLVAWLCEHAAYLLNRQEIGRDGRTSYERSRGKRATALGLEFAEKIFWKEKPLGTMQKLVTQWKMGIFLASSVQVVK